MSIPNPFNFVKNTIKNKMYHESVESSSEIPVNNKKKLDTLERSEVIKRCQNLHDIVEEALTCDSDQRIQLIVLSRLMSEHIVGFNDYESVRKHCFDLIEKETKALEETLDEILKKE